MFIADKYGPGGIAGQVTGTYALRMSEQIGHFCGIAMVRLFHNTEWFREHYGSATWGLARLYLLMEKQRNRGQDGAGIACVHLDARMGEPFYHLKRAPGRTAIDEIFASLGMSPGQNRENNYCDQPGESTDSYTAELYLGHVRYGTDGDNTASTCHPQVRHNNWPSRTLLLAGNFNLTNSADLFRELIGYGQHPIAMIDTVTIMEKIGHFLDRENDRLYHLHGPDGEKGLTGQDLAKKIGADLDLANVLQKATRRWDGGYTIGGLLGHGDAFVCRDPAGIRPCFYIQQDDYFAAASERAALVSSFDVSPRTVKELQPGHCLIIKRDGRVINKPFTEAERLRATPRKSCSFERIYFSRGNDPDIYRERKLLGKNLARRTLEAVDWDTEHTVFSYIPNTSETAFYGLVEEAEKLSAEHEISLLTERQAGKDINLQDVMDLVPPRLRVEKIAHKDQKLRTFITEDADRSTLVSHVYDVTPGVVRHDDSLVVVDDSIVRGTTLRESILAMLAKLNPRRIIVVSSAPPIRYPDCYGIDMSQLDKFIAFQAALSLLRERGEEKLIQEVYESCVKQRDEKNGNYKNHVRRIYDRIDDNDLENRIADLVYPRNTNWQGELKVIYQSVEGLHKAIPEHQGDWYFTGDYPTPGGYRVVNTSFINAYEGHSRRAY